MAVAGATARERARGIRALVLDVDGVLTDGRIHYAPSHPDEEAKSFHCRDGLGLRLAGKAGWHLALLTGRDSQVVARLTLQGQDDIDEVLEQLGAGDETVLGDVPHQYDRHPARLGEVLEMGGDRAHLGR